MFDPCECCLEWRCDPMCSYYVALDTEDEEGKAMVKNKVC